MTETTLTILLTRPREQSFAFADILRRRIGDRIPILVSPILEIRELPMPEIGERPTFLVLTSAHAARAIAAEHRLHGLPAYCVGGATAEAARLAGAEAIACGGTASGLIDRIRRDQPFGKGLYLRGRHVSADLAAELHKGGIEIRSSIVYDQVACPLTVPARELLASYGRVVLPVFSARSARLLAGEVEGAMAELRVVAISEPVAREWPRSTEVTAIAETPNIQAMAEAVSACLTG